MSLAGVLPLEFYERSPEAVAKELLGAIIVRVLGGDRVAYCVIAESEAYGGVEDPASRARRWGGIARKLYGPVGKALIYGMHRQWLLNIVAHEPGGGGAVLIRSCIALSALPGEASVEAAIRRGSVVKGPGRLTRALNVDKSLDGVEVFRPGSPLRVEEWAKPSINDICRSRRVGVSRDLDKPLRFYLKPIYRRVCS